MQLQIAVLSGFPELNKHHYDCSHAWNNGWRKDGVYSISLNAASQPFDVFCRMTPTGGFTVIQRRMDGSVNFDRSWDEYKRGFGDLEVHIHKYMVSVHMLRIISPVLGCEENNGRPMHE